MSRPADIPDVLVDFGRLARARVDEAQALRSPEVVQRAAQNAPPVRSLVESLAAHPFAFIAEVKRASPSEGTIRSAVDPAQVAAGYERAGARAISVLTEPTRFGGSLDDLRAVRERVGLPVLMKDFVVDRYQLAQGREAGADAALLILSLLGPDRTAELHADAVALGLEVLVEVHSEAELKAALELDAALIGINNRDLRTLVVDFEYALQFATLIANSPHRTFVIESGLREGSQAIRAHDAGFGAALVGTSLMRAPDPESALTELVAALDSAQAPND